MTDADYRYEYKRWQDRNSDYRNTWEGVRSEGVRGISIEEHDVPTEKARDTSSGQQYFTNPEEDERRAERHVHVWTVEQP